MDIEKIQETLKLEAPLQSRLETGLTQLTRFLDAERGCMMVTREGNELILFAGDEDLNLKFPFSRSMVGEAMVGSTGLVSFQGEQQDNDTLSSMALHGVRAALCAPILGPGQEDFGIMYFDTRIENKLFTDLQLESVMAIARAIGSLLV